MREHVGDLWEYHRQGAVVVITTGGAVLKNGCCDMPRGCARQARERFPQLSWDLGQQILMHGNHVFDLGRRIVSFPVEDSPLESPRFDLIQRSCQELVELADYKGWPEVIIPRPGCGAGGLEWPEVKRLLQNHLDDRFLVITNEEK